MQQLNKKELPDLRDEVLAFGAELAARIAHHHEQVLSAKPKLREIFSRRNQRSFDLKSRNLFGDIAKYEAKVGEFSRQLSAEHNQTRDDSLLLGLTPLSHQQDAIQHSFRDLRDQIARRDQEINAKSSLVVAGISAAVGLAALFMTGRQIYMASESDAEMKRITDKFDQRMGTQISAMNNLDERLKEQNTLTGKLNSAVDRQLGVIERQDKYNQALLARSPRPRIYINPKLSTDQPDPNSFFMFDIDLGIENSGSKALKGDIYYHIFIPEKLSIHSLGRELSTGVKHDQVINGIQFVEVSGKTAGSVHPGASLGLGNAVLKGTDTQYLMLWYLSTEEGRFPVDAKFGEMNWHVAPKAGE